MTTKHLSNREFHRRFRVWYPFIILDSLRLKQKQIFLHVFSLPWNRSLRGHSSSFMAKFFSKIWNLTLWKIIHLGSKICQNYNKSYPTKTRILRWDLIKVLVGYFLMFGDIWQFEGLHCICDQWSCCTFDFRSHLIQLFELVIPGIFLEKFCSPLYLDKLAGIKAKILFCSSSTSKTSSVFNFWW